MVTFNIRRRHAESRAAGLVGGAAPPGAPGPSHRTWLAGFLATVTDTLTTVTDTGQRAGPGCCGGRPCASANCADGARPGRASVAQPAGPRSACATTAGRPPSVLREATGRAALWMFAVRPLLRTIRSPRMPRRARRTGASCRGLDAGNMKSWMSPARPDPRFDPACQHWKQPLQRRKFLCSYADAVLV
jgi:hypothetical protein